MAHDLARWPSIGEAPINWDVLKIAFLERIFPKEQREDKVEEFINLRHGRMLHKKYSLMFVKLSKCTSSQVSNSKDEMSRFVTGVSKDFVEECQAAMLHNNMDLDRLMIHSQQVEEILQEREANEQ